MPDYAQQISPEDRWAIIAYIRALQLSQNARLSDIPDRSAGASKAKNDHLDATLTEVEPLRRRALHHRRRSRSLLASSARFSIGRNFFALT